jgi:hypothetical protein
MNLRFIFLILISVLELTSCTSIIFGLYGMKKPKNVNEKTIAKYSEKYNIPLTDSYEMDTTYMTYLFSLDTTKYKESINHHAQSLQVLYYDKNGQLQSFQINCYASAFPNLNWNKYDILTTFPPGQQTPLDSIVSLATQFKYLRLLKETITFQANKYDYIVIVYWNRFMGRQSKRLIQLVQNNSNLARDKKIKIIYANTDNIFGSANFEK